jgi:hypothetical protein
MWKRFQYAVIINAENFDPVSAAATLLNPPYWKLLNSIQEKEAKAFILQLMKGDDLHDSPQLNINCLNIYTVDTEDENCEEPLTKWFNHLDHVCNMLETESMHKEVKHNCKYISIKN